MRRGWKRGPPPPDESRQMRPNEAGFCIDKRLLLLFQSRSSCLVMLLHVINYICCSHFFAGYLSLKVTVVRLGFYLSTGIFIVSWHQFTKGSVIQPPKNGGTRPLMSGRWEPLPWLQFLCCNRSQVILLTSNTIPYFSQKKKQCKKFWYVLTILLLKCFRHLNEKQMETVKQALCRNFKIKARGWRHQLMDFWSDCRTNNEYTLLIMSIVAVCPASI